MESEVSLPELLCEVRKRREELNAKRVGLLRRVLQLVQGRVITRGEAEEIIKEGFQNGPGVVLSAGVALS